MIQILLTKVIPPALTASTVILLLLLPHEGGLWLWNTVGMLFALNGLLFIWMQVRKAPNLKIKRDAVFVRGLNISKCDIKAWRIFRTASSGERGRYIEIQLNRVPPPPFGWKLAKLFEQVPASTRNGTLAKEPRIIVSLNSWDLTKDEISNALENSKQSAPSDGE